MYTWWNIGGSMLVVVSQTFVSGKLTRNTLVFFHGIPPNIPWLSPSTSAIKTGMKEDPQSAWWYWWLLVINDYIIEYNWWLISIIVPISCNVPGIWWSWLPISVMLDSPPLFFHIVPRVKSLVINTHVGGWSSIHQQGLVSPCFLRIPMKWIEMGWLKCHFPHSSHSWPWHIII